MIEFPGQQRNRGAKKHRVIKKVEKKKPEEWTQKEKDRARKTKSVKGGKNTRSNALEQGGFGKKSLKRKKKKPKTNYRLEGKKRSSTGDYKNTGGGAPMGNG